VLFSYSQLQATATAKSGGTAMATSAGTAIAEHSGLALASIWAWGEARQGALARGLSCPCTEHHHSSRQMKQVAKLHLPMAAAVQRTTAGLYG